MIESPEFEHGMSVNSMNRRQALCQAAPGWGSWDCSACWVMPGIWDSAGATLQAATVRR